MPNGLLPNGLAKTPILLPLTWVIRFGLPSKISCAEQSERLQNLQATCSRYSFPKLPHPDMPKLQVTKIISVPADQASQLSTITNVVDLGYQIESRPRFLTRGQDWQYIEETFSRRGSLLGISDADFRGFTLNGYIAGIGPHTHDDPFEISSWIGHSMRIMENHPEIGIWGFPSRIQNESCVSGVNRPYHPVQRPTLRAFNPKGLIFVRDNCKAPGAYLHADFLEDISRPLAEIHAGGKAGVCNTISRTWYKQSNTGAAYRQHSGWKIARKQLVQKYGEPAVGLVVKSE